MATNKASTSRKSAKPAGKTKARTTKRKTAAASTGTRKASAARKTASSTTTRKSSARKPTEKTGSTKATKKAVKANKATRHKTPSASAGKSRAKNSAAPRGSSGRPPAGESQRESTGRVTVQLGSEQIELAEEGRPIPKTKVTRKELREFKELLLAKRQELISDMENLTDQALSGNRASGGFSTMPLHMADVGSDNWEQEFTLGLIENERALVREVDDALERIRNRTYGVCLATHRAIDSARLRAKPWAKYCVEYARLREMGRVP